MPYGIFILSFLTKETEKFKSKITHNEREGGQSESRVCFHLSASWLWLQCGQPSHDSHLSAMVDCTFRPCDGINPSLLKLLLSSIGHSTEKVTNSPPHQSHHQTGSSPPDASQNHPALSTLQAQLTMAIWVQREFTSLYLGLSSRRHGGQVSVCASLQYAVR